MTVANDTDAKPARPAPAAMRGSKLTFLGRDQAAPGEDASDGLGVDVWLSTDDGLGLAHVVRAHRRVGALPLAGVLRMHSQRVGGHSPVLAAYASWGAVAFQRGLLGANDYADCHEASCGASVRWMASAGLRLRGVDAMPILEAFEQAAIAAACRAARVAPAGADRSIRCHALGVAHGAQGREGWLQVDLGRSDPWFVWSNIVGATAQGRLWSRSDLLAPNAAEDRDGYLLKVAVRDVSDMGCVNRALEDLRWLGIDGLVEVRYAPRPHEAASEAEARDGCVAASSGRGTTCDWTALPSRVPAWRATVADLEARHVAGFAG